MSHAIRMSRPGKIGLLVLVAVAAVIVVAAYSFYGQTLPSRIGGMAQELSGQSNSHSSDSAVLEEWSPVVEAVVAAEPVAVESDTDRVLENLKEANAAFNTPESIDLHRTKRVHFLLSPDVPTHVLAAMIDASDGDRLETAPIRFHQRVEAKLTGAGFEIQPITREIQGVASHGVSEWKWDVTAMETGTHTLHLSVSVLFIADGVDTGTSIKTFEQDIHVEVRALDLVKGIILNEWQWLWSAILVPLAGWLWLTWQKRRARQKERGLDSARFYAVG